jgi:hypothetical protein
MDLSKIDFDTWMEIGLHRGFVGPPVCSTHDGIPYTLEEEEEFEDGLDPCVHVIRPYSSLEEKKSVEENHPPTTWRNPLVSGG